MTPRRNKRSNTLTDGISIVVSSPGQSKEEDVLLHWIPPPDASHHIAPDEVSTDGRMVHPQTAESRPYREAFTGSVREGKDGISSSDTESCSDEIRPRANTEVERSQSSEPEQKIPRSWSDSARIKIINHNYYLVPLTPTGAAEYKVGKQPKPPNKSVSCPDEHVQSLKKLQAVKVHPPLSESRSAPGNMYRGGTPPPNVDEIDSESVDSDTSALEMSVNHEREQVPTSSSPVSKKRHGKFDIQHLRSAHF